MSKPDKHDTKQTPMIAYKPRRHKWDNETEKRIAATEFSDGNARNIKSCQVCSMKRITVIPPNGFPWHEWLTADGRKWVGETTPPCFPQAENVVTT